MKGLLSRWFLLICLLGLALFAAAPTWAVIGPHEGGNNPAIEDKLGAAPITVIIRSGDVNAVGEGGLDPQRWVNTVQRYRGERQMVIRIADWEASLSEAHATGLGQKVRQLLGDKVTDGTIVVFGNEMNRLNDEWKNEGMSVSQAGAAYCKLFKAFEQGLLGTDGYEPFRPAAAPPDMANSFYSWKGWYEGLKQGGCGDVFTRSDTATVLNAYDLTAGGGADVKAAVEDFLATTGASYDDIDFFTEWGPWPEATLKQHIDWLGDAANEPEARLGKAIPATTLVPDHCKANSDGTPWLFWVNGTLYDVGGNEVEVGEDNTCKTSQETGGNVYLRPDSTQLRAYLANSQVYCGPQQLYFRDLIGPEPVLNNCREWGTGVRGEKEVYVPDGNQDGDYVNVAEEAVSGVGQSGRIAIADAQCTQYEYPILKSSSTWDLEAGGVLSIPLWRSDTGGLSIEADLSRVDPKDTLLSATLRNTRPEYAPQFYLTSPEQQCKNAVQFRNQVRTWCESYVPTEDKPECPLNTRITLSSGASYRLLDGIFDAELSDEAICDDFSARIAEDSVATQAVFAISPQVPKYFKLGYLVVHTWFHEANLLEQSIYLKQVIASWFASTLFPSPNQPLPGEQLLVVPVWYNAGVAATAADDRAGGNLYPFDPDQNPNQIAKEDLLNAAAWQSSWWRTYSLALPLHVQQNVALQRRQQVYDSAGLMDQALAQLGQEQVQMYNRDGSLAHDTATVDPIIECRNGQCLCDPAEDENCPNNSAVDIYGALTPGSAEEIEIDEGTAVGYVSELRRQLVARINAGVQRTVPVEEGQKSGPFTERTFYRCPADFQGLAEPVLNDPTLANASTTGFGWSETAETIGSAMLRDGIVGAIGAATTEFWSKVVPPPAQDEPDPARLSNQRKATRTYLVLPEEAASKEYGQAVVAPMFLSPETYAGIVQGKNPIWPFEKQAKEQQAGAQKPAVGTFLSAFLRTLGFGRSHDTDTQAGYAVYKQKITQYQLISSCTPGGATDPNTGITLPPTNPNAGPTVQSLQLSREQALLAQGATIDTPDTADPGGFAQSSSGDGSSAGSGRSCTCEVSQTKLDEEEIYLMATNTESPDGGEYWVPIGDIVEENQAATCENGGIAKAVWKEKESRVEVKDADPNKPVGEQFNTNPETPGQLAAMHEFFRRLAFTPLHMQTWDEYLGLEALYGGAGDVICEPVGQTTSQPVGDGTLEGAKVIALGDSITGGHRTGPPEGYTENLRSLLAKANVLSPKAYPGEGPATVYPKGVQAVVAEDPDYVLVHLGTNYLQASLDTTNNSQVNALRSIVSELSNHTGADGKPLQVMLATIIPRPAYLGSSGAVGTGNVEQQAWTNFNDAVRSMQGPNVQIVEMANLFGSPGSIDMSMYHTDGIHLSDAGRQKMAEAWVAALGETPNGSSPSTSEGKQRCYRVSQADIGSQGGSVRNQCVYPTPRQIDVNEYMNVDNLNNMICQKVAAGEVAVNPAIVRAILETEGRSFRQARQNGGIMVCQSNQVGATGPMNIVVGQCSKSSTGAASSLNRDLNAVDSKGNPVPDLCDLPTAIEVALRVDFSQGVKNIQYYYDLDPSKLTVYQQAEIIAEAYHGLGSCGCLSTNAGKDCTVKPGGYTYRNDGVSSLTGTGNNIDLNNEAEAQQGDYCHYVANLAASYGNLCR